MRFGMMAAVGMLAATAGMAHEERESGKPWSVPEYSGALAWARTDLNFESGNVTMMTVDLPNAAPPAQVVLIAQAPQAGTPVKERVIGSCQAIDYHFPTESDGSYWGESNGSLDPQTPAELYFSRYENRPDVQRPPLDAVEVLTQPQHGVVKLGVSGGGDPGYNYIPDVDYIGTDKVAFRVMTSAGPVVVQYYLVVTNKGSESKAAERLCDKASKRPNSMAGWKISSSFTTPNLDNAALQSLLDAAGIENKRGQTTVSRVNEACRHG